MALLFILLQLAGLSNVARTNELTRAAGQAFAKGDYKTASKAYSDMVTKYNVDDDAVTTNLAHSYFRTGDVVNATRYYSVLSAKSKDATLRSMANTQLGVISARQNNYPEAKERFKDALRQDPNNTLARMNYERLMRSKPNLQPPPPPEKKKSEEKRKKEEEKKQQENKEKQQGGTNTKPGEENKPQQTKEQEKEQQKQQKQGEGKDQPQVGQDQKEKKGQKSKTGQQDPNQKEPDPNKDGKEKDNEKAQEDESGQEATREQLKKMQLSEEKSRQILDAMRAGEMQYLQQKRFRRRDAGKGGKNDW